MLRSRLGRALYLHLSKLIDLEFWENRCLYSLLQKSVIHMQPAPCSGSLVLDRSPRSKVDGRVILKGSLGKGGGRPVAISGGERYDTTDLELHTGACQPATLCSISTTLRTCSVADLNAWGFWWQELSDIVNCPRCAHSELG